MGIETKIIDKGTFTIGEQTWYYQTSNSRYNGEKYYATDAITINESKGQLISVAYIDDNSGTLKQLKEFINTFNGDQI
jgi:hypothetical protein